MDDTRKKRIISSHCLGSDSRAALLDYLWGKKENTESVVSSPIREGVTSHGHGIAGHLQRDVSRGSPARSELHPWVGALGTTDLRGSWETLATKLLLPVGRRTSSCGLVPCKTHNCVPRSAGLGWENNSAQCLSWGFSSLPSLQRRCCACASHVLAWLSSHKPLP